ncbi:hypothetical protein OROHE_024623 [Orobanche hederae]
MPTLTVFLQTPKTPFLEIQRENHIHYLSNGFFNLGPAFTVLDANRPWLCCWTLHSLAVLGGVVDEGIKANAVDFLSRSQDSEGGYGGGPGQLPHLATTYASVNSLVTLDGERALSSINRFLSGSGLFIALMNKRIFICLDITFKHSGDLMYSIVLSLMHDGGEIDVRACYTAISVASILNILDGELVRNVGDYIFQVVRLMKVKSRANLVPRLMVGKYTFCGLAAMVLINEVHCLDLPRLIDWIVFRQGVEGGFQGRTNKLVDGCYSFWQFFKCCILAYMNNYEPSDVESWRGSDDLKNEGRDNFHHPESLTAIGRDFIMSKRTMKPIFNSIRLQRRRQASEINLRSLEITITPATA